MARYLGIAGSRGLFVIDEPQRRAIGGEAVAAAEAMFVVDLTIAGGLKLDQPVARTVAERPGDARRRIAVAEDRIFALEPPRQPRVLFAPALGEQGLAMHIKARGGVAEGLDTIGTACRKVGKE